MNTKTPMIRRCRHDKENPYVQISREMLKDKNITPKDKGVLCFILSNHHDWVVRLDHLAEQLNVGRDYIRSSITNLKKAGYCRHYQQKNELGQYFFSGYEFSEYPMLDNNLSEKSKVETEPTSEIQKSFPQTAFPTSDKPTSESPTLIKISPNKEKSNENIEKEKIYKKEKEIEPEKKQLRDCVCLTHDQHTKLLAIHGKDKLESMLDILDSYKSSHTTKYKSDYGVMKRGGWVDNEHNKRQKLGEKYGNTKWQQPTVERTSKDNSTQIPTWMRERKG